MFEKVGAVLGWNAFAAPEGDGAHDGAVVVWELRSMELEFWGRKRRLAMPGMLPAGYLVLSPNGKFVAAVGGTTGDAPGDRENETMFRSHFPGAGEYRIENGRLITRMAQNGQADAVQSHECNLDGRWLEVATSWLVGSRESSDIRRIVFGFQKMA